MKYKNRNGTTGLKCSCKSWLDHWERLAPASMAERLYGIDCSVYGCAEKATVGGHVHQANSDGIVTDASVFILPLCDKCNKRDEAFEVKNGRQAVSANKSLTCG